MSHSTTENIVLAGRYRLSAVIGEGGMARIYRATDQRLDRPVAVKVLNPDLARDERLLARFRHEAKIGASVSHPALVKVYDAGSDDGSHFIVMELVHGRTLEDLIGEKAPLPPARAVEIADRVCAVLGTAHEHGYVHGDVKPANIILTRSGDLKVIDFGSVPAKNGSAEVVLGTRDYCSPEQATGGLVDPRSDIYSLGVVLHRMLTGGLPSASELPASVPASLRAVVERATSTDPADRQATARELSTELVQALREASVPARPPTKSGLTAPLPVDESPSPERRTLPLPIRLAAVNAFGVAAALMVVIGLTLQITRADLSAEPGRRLEAVARSFEQGPAQDLAGPGLTEDARDWLAAQPSPDDQAIAIRTERGDVLTASGGLDLQQIPEAATLLRSGESRWWNLTGNGTRYLALTVPLVRDGQQVGTLVAVAEQTRAEATWRTVLSTVVGASVVGLAFATLLAFATVRRTLRPLSRISSQADAIHTENDLSRRVGEDGPPDEVGRLAIAFNRMLNRLENTVRSQRRFVADASHELRTPLTVAKGQLELATAEVDQPEARQALALVDTELDRMGRIVQELLLLTQLDEGLPLARESVEVELVLQEALLRGLRGARRETMVRAGPSLQVTADRDRLLQVLSNLVTNAVQHAGDGARIHLIARHRDDLVAIEVRDDGRGIPADDLPHLFDRFYRARNEPGGAGLGLAIASSITRAMGGKITVTSAEGHGTTFTVLLPGGPPVLADGGGVGAP